MLNRFYHFHDISEPLDGKAGAGIPVAHLVDARDSESSRQLLGHHYSAEGNYPFCIALRDPGSASPEIVRHLLLFFFHPQYERSEQGKPLFLCGMGAEETEVQDYLRDFFAAQRLTVEVTPMSSLDPADIYPGDGASLRSRDPLFFSTAVENVRLRSECNRLIAAQTALQEEIGILKELLQLSGKHDEVSEILRFYRNEYEILPLWYKRAGHVLKVIMGKRSFRSLYDKTKKKYRD
ncbi:MAG TPA: hypothetical protein VFE32_17105 [Puia sp.]|jgi:hypothetical protein|nr:hypothetical protein [Puia sp.]